MVEKEAVRMSYCELGVRWVGGWVGGRLTYLSHHLPQQEEERRCWGGA